MDPVAHQFGPLAGLVAIFLTVSVLAVAGRQREQRGLDLVMALGLLAWMVFLVWQPRFAPSPPGPVDEFVEHMGFQLCVSAACGLALTGARVQGHLPWLVWTYQLIGGGGVLLVWTVSGVPYWFDFWEATNWIVVGGVLAVLAQHWARRREQRTMGILVLSVVLLVYGLLADVWHHPTSRVAIAGMFIYPAALVGLWSLVSAQVRADMAVYRNGQREQQRQRIAQDVHDGVGSQLVAILSSLDLRQPDQKALAIALEQCLLDLKITVDSLQQETPSLLDGLAMLRYRIQPSLTRLGVELSWQLQDHEAIRRLPSLRVTHSLRIAQEAVANVLRHSDADCMTVICRYLPESHEVELVVQDDGRGLPLASDERGRVGRGLTGMRRRAQEAGLRLDIRSQPTLGTTVELRIPAPDRPHEPSEPERLGYASV